MRDLGSVVLVNSGPLIALGKLNRLGLLSDLYGRVHVPDAVYQEVVTDGISKGSSDALTVRLYLSLQPSTIIDSSEDTLQKYSPPVVLGRGERAVLTVALTVTDPLVLLDDETARREARRLGLRLKGTVGVLVQAYRAGIISERELELLLAEIEARGDIWISPKLCQQVLAELRRTAPDGG